MAQAFESVASAAVRRRLSSSVVDATKPNVAATYASLTVRINLSNRGLSLLIVCLADVGCRRRRCDQ